MAENRVDIQLKVVATYGERSYESSLNREKGIQVNGLRMINIWDIEDALKRYILRNCDDEVILKEIAVNDDDKRQMAYNTNLSQQMADDLADELCHTDAGGTYPYEFCIILSNPCVSGKKLDSFVNLFLEEYQYSVEVNEGKQNFEIIYLLKYIAQNPAVWESTLETLKRSNIPIVVEAAKR